MQMNQINSWQIPRFTKIDIIFILLSMFPLALIRSSAYMTSPSGADVYYLVEKTMPLKYWGVLVGMNVAILFWGILMRNHKWIWIGHSSSALVSLVLMVGIILSYFGSDVSLMSTLTYLSFLITPFVLHMIFSIRMGPIPVDPNADNRPTETVVGDNGK